jgi:DNA ligase (NAD+)
VPDVIEIRGEVVVPFAEFERVNAEREANGESSFANPRNLAAGTLRQQDVSEVEARGRRIVFFGVGACEPHRVLPERQSELPALFAAWGLPAVENAWAGRGTAGALAGVDACRAARADFPFPTDGAVVKLDVLALQREAGSDDSVPRWAIAYKFAPERAETQVLAITVQVGRTGALTPVAELAPVQLGGTTVMRATLHNRDEIARKDIRIGDTVLIEKAGEIIPAVIGVNLGRRLAGTLPYMFPRACPECRHQVAQAVASPIVRCVNGTCPAQLRRRIEHFASKSAVNIPGIGAATVEALVTHGLVRELPDLYRLRGEDLAALGKNVGKAAGQLLAGIEASKRAELWRFVYGLGIPQVGAGAAREVAERYGSFEALLTASGETRPARVGPNSRDEAAIRAALNFFAEPKNRAGVEALLAAGVRPTAPRTAAGTTLVRGKTFVLTGALPTLTRAEVTRRIEAAGGKVSGSVSRSTHYVVAGADAGAKLEQAKTLGIATLDEAALLRMLAED